MKKLCVIFLSAGLVLGFSFVSANSADAAAKKFKNCTELNNSYKGGVARSSSVKNKGGKTKYKPYVSQALYDANSSLDRDKDFIACEK
ncbi:excalibur calcium-binding domain-containing protein [Neobacillus cucumis]|uniref:excalibur calcium-binding domain-containing protein n=1 Tax=Neobacillus cucumis TaxID=1740721 RepID=UPI001962677B|nr:excalibur calcium-binding domain-containing protein [Neobacillus cucumis]MBM7651289.1 hypothetical protein [Neobacillus cucumis]